jgi:gluconate 2-dehydrogenase gamma chain
MTSNEFGRRAFVKAAGTAVGGMILIPGCTSSVGKWRFFADAEATVVEAIAEQIIPADQDAGARDAYVVNYIDRQLATVFEEQQEIYRSGIAGVQQTSNIMFDEDLESLEWPQQTEVLNALENGEAEGTIWETESARSFFELIRTHTNNAGLLWQPTSRRQPGFCQLPHDRH